MAASSAVLFTNVNEVNDQRVTSEEYQVCNVNDGAVSGINVCAHRLSVVTIPRHANQFHESDEFYPCDNERVNSRDLPAKR